MTITDSLAPAAGTTAGRLARFIDWIDDKGRPAWIALMVGSCIAVWPVGLLLTGWLIWSGRLGGGGCSRSRSSGSWVQQTQSGNSAFDAYREETLRRLEQEHRDFQAYLQRLREARDRAEFDQFRNERDTAHKPSVGAQDASKGNA